LPSLNAPTDNAADPSSVNLNTDVTITNPTFDQSITVNLETVPTLASVAATSYIFFSLYIFILSKIFFLLEEERYHVGQ
jgi:hypothetical protein